MRVKGDFIIELSKPNPPPFNEEEIHIDCLSLQGITHSNRGQVFGKKLIIYTHPPPFYGIFALRRRRWTKIISHKKESVIYI